MRGSGSVWETALAGGRIHGAGRSVGGCVLCIYSSDAPTDAPRLLGEESLSSAAGAGGGAPERGLGRVEKEVPRLMEDLPPTS